MRGGWAALNFNIALELYMNWNLYYELIQLVIELQFEAKM